MKSSRAKNHHSRRLSNQEEKNQHEPRNAFHSNAPINDSEEQDKDHFHKKLQSVNDICSERDVKKDLNTKKVSDDNRYQEALGQHGLGEMNVNRIEDTLKRLVVGG